MKLRRYAVGLALVLAGILAVPLPAQAAGAPAAGSIAWLRADAGVTVNGSSVSNWADQSGGGHHAVMATPARQPQLVQNAVNGQPALRFNGAQSMYFPSPVNPFTFSVFVVGKNSKSSGYSMILGPGGNYPNNQMRWENSNQALFVGLGNNMPVCTSTIGNNKVYHALSARYDGNTMRVYRDGVLKSSHTFSTNTGWTLVSIGSWFSSYFMVGDLAEVIVYQSALSDADRTATDNYLRTKYALP
ncbi:LamG-like jellyroll fold domain-containing protein [Longispora sp. NPDC051575]|uniref:LamG-like jellyroll fold domain-containing protein n=1 Tax=Longispora sp. NPDC051575 TaxID=3154943 RepID=UPI00341BF766